MLKSIKLFLILIFVCAAQLHAERIVLKEDFDSTISELKSRGWVFPSAGTKIVNGKTSKGLQITSTSRNRYVKFYFPIKPGKNYSGTINIKCRDVKKIKKRDRGAILFFQLADKNKQHIIGGTFPKGIHGTTSKWQRHSVPFTRIRKPEVKFLNITIGIEGTGSAIFDNLVVTEITDTVQLLSPKNNALVKSSRPELKWTASPAGLVEVSVSRSPDFPDNKTFTFFSQKKNNYLQPDFALASGKWYWKAKAYNPNLKSSQYASFVISKDASKYPVAIFPLWENKYSGQHPILKAKIYPPQTINGLNITIANQKAKIISMQNGLLSFSPAQKIGKSIYNVIIKTNKQSHNFIYSTVESPNKISFRKDKIMLINNKAFFPLGAYRDPSDSIDDFSGLQEAGFNLTHDYRFETPAKNKGTLKEAKKYLKNAERHAIKVFMGIRRNDVRKLNSPAIQKYCAVLKGYKSLLTWYLYDEPLCTHSMIPIIGLEKAYKAIKSVDSTHPVNIVFAMMPTAKEMKSLNKTFDLFWTDNYPVKADVFDVPQYYDFLLKSKAKAGKKPFWSVIQAFDPNIWYEKSKVPKYPTPKQSRLLAHLSLAAGAEGIIWYWSPSRMTYNIKKDTPHIWKGICDTVQEIKSLIPFLTGNRSKYSLQIHPNLRYWSYAANGKRVLAIMNISNQKMQVDISIKLSSKNLIRRFETGKKIKLSSGKLQASLDAYEVKIYIWNE